jgi:phosphonatase-like hydrolase
MSYQLVVFDIAGTTVIDKGNINQAFRQAFANKGLTVSKEDVDLVMGYEKMEAIQILNNKYNFNLGAVTIAAIHASFIDEMVDFYMNDTTLQPQPYAVEIFEWLQSQHIKIALNTGFNRKITDAVLFNLKWHQHPFINAVVCSDEVAKGRPEPYMIQKIMEVLDITSNSNVIKVGDTEVDINEGRNAGCGLVIGVTTGAFKREELVSYHPDYIIDSLLELQEIIQTK